MEIYQIVISCTTGIILTILIFNIGKIFNTTNIIVEIRKLLKVINELLIDFGFIERKEGFKWVWRYNTSSPIKSIKILLKRQVIANKIKLLGILVPYDVGKWTKQKFLIGQ